jgi:hypothetical protein
VRLTRRRAHCGILLVVEMRDQLVATALNFGRLSREVHGFVSLARLAQRIARGCLQAG